MRFEHIVFFRPGLRLQFRKNGDVKYAFEAEHLIEALVRNNPDVHFHIISDCEYDREVPSNNFEFTLLENFHIEPYHFYDEGPIKSRLKFEIDGIIFMPGPYVGSLDDGYFRNHTSPYLEFIRDTVGIPAIQISTDPRWHWEDVFPDRGIKTLGQYEYKTKTGVEVHYNGVEHLSTIMWPIPEFNSDEHVLEMILISNAKPIERFLELEEYILKDYGSVPVYGTVLEGKENSYPGLKGRLPYAEAWRQQRSAKITLIVPIEKGWVTSKYLECLYRGVLPILHPTYDQRNLLDIPESLRAKDKSDFDSKVRYWLSNDQEREEMVKILQKKFFTPEDQSGKTISGLVMSELKKEYIRLR